MTFLEELRDIQNCILGKSQELNSKSRIGGKNYFVVFLFYLKHQVSI